ncbi:hypothetical protein TNCT_315451 [Trichonephila clavata]|uniref:Uncharacterized protein n=1 Tax=Trichonephila clavata TaxID=2740835 RepID=A0A8X6HEI8_TRICU|nr:hypothetical protein TNCT_315451 [Trichonephila clavata]
MRPTPPRLLLQPVPLAQIPSESSRPMERILIKIFLSLPTEISETVAPNPGSRRTSDRNQKLFHNSFYHANRPPLSPNGGSVKDGMVSMRRGKMFCF